MVTTGCDHLLSSPPVPPSAPPSLTTDRQPIPVQLSPLAPNLWTVSSLTDNHWTTHILYTSSTNSTKALTEMIGEAALTASSNNKPPLPAATPRPSLPKCWMLRDSVAALANNPLLATCHVLGGSVSLYCAIWSKNLMCHCLGRIYASMSAHSRPLMLSASDMSGWNVNSELKLISNSLCLYFSSYDLTLYVNLWLM